MNIITKTNNADTTSNSLRTTIPTEVVDKLGLSKGDNIVWVIEDENSVCIKKLKFDKY